MQNSAWNDFYFFEWTEHFWVICWLMPTSRCAYFLVMQCLSPIFIWKWSSSNNVVCFMPACFPCVKISHLSKILDNHSLGFPQNKQRNKQTNSYSPNFPSSLGRNCFHSATAVQALSAKQQVVQFTPVWCHYTIFNVHYRIKLCHNHHFVYDT